MSEKIRVLIAETFQSDADLNAFCLDYFRRTFDRFSDSMDRVAKINLLLTLEDEEEILEKLALENRSSRRRLGRRRGRKLWILLGGSLVAAVPITALLIRHFHPATDRQTSASLKVTLLSSNDFDTQKIPERDPIAFVEYLTVLGVNAEVKSTVSFDSHTKEKRISSCPG